jgi:hypothetical protein
MKLRAATNFTNDAIREIRGNSWLFISGSGQSSLMESTWIVFALRFPVTVTRRWSFLDLSFYNARAFLFPLASNLRSESRLA